MKFCRQISFLNARGSVVMAVIWAIAMLSIFMLAIYRQVSVELTFGRWMMDRMVTRNLAKAGFERALLELQSDKFQAFDALNENWGSNADAFKAAPLGEGMFTVVCNDHQQNDEKASGVRFGLCDEQARVNLNTAAESVLAGLLRAVDPELSDKERTEIAQAIIDWRDTDDHALTQGAEENYYKSLKKPYEPRDQNFESTEELALVRGITPELYKALSPYITVYTDGKINFNTAPAKVFEALGLSPELAQRLEDFRKGGDLTIGTQDDEFFQTVDEIAPALSASGSFSGEDFAQITTAIGQNTAGVTSAVFRIYAAGRLIRGSHQAESKLTSVVEREGKVLYWRED